LANHAAYPVTHGLEIRPPFQQVGPIGERTAPWIKDLEIDLQGFVQGFGPFDGAAAVDVMDVRLRVGRLLLCELVV
jgi:hypothetical protein